jgi:hypothetical protein
MFDKNDRLESQPSRKRFLYGKDIEKSIVECLRHHYNFIIEEAEKKVDCDDKIDCFLIENDVKIPCQVKTRMGYSGSDILADIYEPFLGIDNENTKKGRDYVGRYEKYIVLIKDTIYIIDGKRQKEIIENVLAEWEASHHQLPVFNSNQYDGVQIRYTTDKNNSRPKILMFIDPSVYKKETEIKCYEMKWPADKK